VEVHHHRNGRGYEPWNLTLPGGKLSGFEPELMANLCQRMGIECKLVVQNWDGMIAGLNAGKYDVIMDAIVITPERKQVVSFTIPYAATPASFIAVKGTLLPPATGPTTPSSLTMMKKRFRRRLRH
jgi:octopine/nopaline transport system substrate-binding protein